MYKYFQKLKRIVVIIIYKIFCIFKINSNKILLYAPSDNQLKGNLLEIKNSITDKTIRIFYKRSNIVLLLYELATSKIIIIDDYAPIIYSLKIRKSVKFIQVWHASGVFKNVGFKRPNVNKNSITHKNYTDVIVSSTNIIKDYSEAFCIDESKIFALGTIKTDLFFNTNRLDMLEKEFNEKYKIKDKKIILYAPTFRGNGIKSAHFKNILDLESLSTKLGDDYIILFKNHPFVKTKNTFLNSNIIDISDSEIIDYILPFIDLVITDYSSVIFDAALLSKPIVLYVPDLQEYEIKRGFYYNFESYNYGSIVYKETELIEAIKLSKIDHKKLKELKEKHLNMCDGKSLERFKKMYLN